jgi:hypothetical protein
MRIKIVDREVGPDLDIVVDGYGVELNGTDFRGGTKGERTDGTGEGCVVSFGGRTWLQRLRDAWQALRE